MRPLFLVMLLLTAGVGGSFSHAQDEVADWQMKKTEGEVFEVDYSSSTMTVKFLQSIEDLVYDQIVFTVPRTTKIVKGGDVIELDDIAVGDHVKVRYYNDKSGLMKILDITVMV